MNQQPQKPWTITLEQRHWQCGAYRCFAAFLIGVGVTAAAGFAFPPGTNVDESKVPPYTLPDPLICADGTLVKDAQTWWQKRRPELVRLFENEVYGKTLLGRLESLRFVVREEKKDARGGKATRLRIGILFEGTEDGRQMELLLYLPNDVKGPVPMFFGLNFDGNYATTDEPDLPVPKHWVRDSGDKSARHRPIEAMRGRHKGRWQYDLALSHGYGVATACYCEVEPDEDGHWRAGPRGLGPQPEPSDWGCIGAWAWALSRALDYLETNPRVDAKHVAVMGLSRLGKTALWAGAQDQRFALVVSIDSGAGGAALSKRIFGEAVTHSIGLSGRWYCSNYAKYVDRESDLPIDQHELAALIAPRPLLILSATEDPWADPKGEFLSGVGADPVYRLLGADGISQQEWPQPGRLLTSRIGYFLRPGQHDATLEDWKALVRFASAVATPSEVTTSEQR